MTPPSKWLFFPSPVASSSVQLEVDFTLVDTGSQRFDGTSPTWSGTDAGSPDNYALGSPQLRHRNGRTLIRMAFGASGDYANRGDWIAANGNTILYQTTKFTRADGTVSAKHVKHINLRGLDEYHFIPFMEYQRQQRDLVQRPLRRRHLQYQTRLVTFKENNHGHDLYFRFSHAGSCHRSRWTRHARLRLQGNCSSYRFG